MHQPPPTGIKKYIISDLIAAYLGWLVFFVIRKSEVEHLPIDIHTYLKDDNFLYGGIAVSLYWLYIYALTNTYQSIYTKSRIAEILKTIVQSLLGCLFLSILVVLDDLVDNYKDYYYLMNVMILTHLIPTLFFRIAWLFSAKSDIKTGRIKFPTLIIGNHPDIAEIYNDAKTLQPLQGISVESIWTNLKNIHVEIPTEEYIITELETKLRSSHYTHVILALSKEEKDQLSTYISLIDDTGIKIKVIPELHESLTSHTKISNPLGAPLIDINTDVMTPWQISVKKILDITISVLAVTILLPLLVVIAILIKRNSPGPILYKQERIGQYGKPFTIYKFRSMYVNAEAGGPQLSKTGDDRTTTIGQFIRKYRIDELPQFFNVLKGDMSLVGPRPERKFFADQIIQKTPEYKFIYKMLPGITSWGMVRFGYASSVDEMITRMRYDLMYVNNFSLLMDFRILIYTVMTIIKGKGL